MAFPSWPEADPNYIADYPVLWGEAAADPLTGKEEDPIVGTPRVRVLRQNPATQVLEVDVDSALEVLATQVQAPAHTISRIQGGVAGANYYVEIEVDLESGQRFQRTIKLPVRDL